jgi:hypothetical protein
MIWENSDLKKILFKGFDPLSYISEHNIAELVGVSLSNYGDPTKKQVKGPSHAVNPDLLEAFSPELDDLSKLHWLVLSRHVTTILEFGLGKSTIIFNNALVKNKISDDEFVAANLRRNNRYECHSVDNYEKWIEEVKSKNDLERVFYHKSNLVMGTFNGRACTYYDPLPNLCPDLIYLDGPDQFSPKGDVRGITTNQKDRMPMSADILVFEHFLTPGTLIVTDGRTANARFLKENLQRSWCYCHDVEADQHYFELLEEPLGPYNLQQIDFCLGDTYFERLRLLQGKLSRNFE